MKAKETREFLDKLNCEVCGYAKEMMEKGLCFHSCEDHFRLEETIDTELTELERLAEIGLIVEALFENKIDLFVNPKWCNGALESYDYSLVSLKDLILWHKGK